MTTIVWHGCGTEADGIDDGTDADADADADTVRFDRNGRLPGLEIEDPPGFHLEFRLLFYQQGITQAQSPHCCGCDCAMQLCFK